MPPAFLAKLADKTGKPLVDYELAWAKGREAILERFGNRRGTFVFVRTVLEFLRQTGHKIQDLET